MTENLDLANSSFDAALCRWGLMLLPNLDAVIGKIYSSLVSGGRFAAAVWADAPKVPIIGLATFVYSNPPFLKKNRNKIRAAYMKQVLV